MYNIWLYKHAVRTFKKNCLLALHKLTANGTEALPWSFLRWDESKNSGDVATLYRENGREYVRWICQSDDYIDSFVIYPDPGIIPIFSQKVSSVAFIGDQITIDITHLYVS